MKFTATLLALAGAGTALAEPRPAEKGKATFRAIDDQAQVAKCYRLEPYNFDFELKPVRELTVSGIDISHLTFPSPVASPHASNNTVHADYYRPAGLGPFPGVIVLDILDGSQVVSRGLANVFAQNGIAALIVTMPYYGPRRPTGENLRLISPNIDQTFVNIRQTVLDNRCAAAWLAARPEIDAKKLGIHGTSLGSFMGALTAAAEPRLHRVSLMLGGGGLIDAYAGHPKAQPIFAALALVGGSKEALKAIVASADPITYAAELKKRKLLMIAASRDDVVPPAAATALWEATGKQKIVWFNSTHVGAAVHLFDATQHIVKHFKAD